MLLGSQVMANKIDHEAAKRITPQSNAKIPASILRAGDLVTVRVGDPGTTAVIADELDGCNCASLMIVRRSTFFDSAWLAHLMNSPLGRRQVENVQYGTAQKQFNIGDAVGFLFPVPSKVEQNAIADALTDADSLIDSLEQLLTKKRQIKQGAMQELLTGKRRLPGFGLKWGQRQLGDLLSIRHGRDQKLVECDSGEYPILATGGQIGWASAYLHAGPSVLIGRKGTIDKPRYMDTPFWSVDTLFYSEVLRPNVAKFLYYRFCLIDWMRHNEASGVPSLGAKVIEGIEISCPSPDEQQAIADVLSDLDDEITILESRLTKARALKQAMAQALLTGRIRLVESTA